MPSKNIEIPTDIDIHTYTATSIKIDTEIMKESLDNVLNEFVSSVVDTSNVVDASIKRAQNIIKYLKKETNIISTTRIYG